MIYDILRKVKSQINIMMWLTIILALVIVSGVYTYARYTYHTEVTGVTVTVPGIGYCAYNGMTLADCVLVTDADEPYETVSIAKTAIEAKTEVTSFSEISETDEGLYDAEDDYGTSYYFRGAVEDNYVEYAGYIWRIIRVNGDGSVRMILNESYTTSVFNENYDDNAYVGYMYGTTGASTYSATHTNTNNSTIKTVVDEFYEEKLDATDTTDKDGNKYSAYLSDTLFCNDRSVYSGTGIGTTSTGYNGRDRLNANNSPTLICTNQNDEFTVKTTTLDDGTKVGNAALKYPIGLITVDEVSMAGGVYELSNTNTSYYLYIGSVFWTMTPSRFGSYAYVLYLGAKGHIGDPSVNNKLDVRPVINLSSDVYVYSGTGTQDDPYEVSLTRRVDSGCDGELSCVMLLNSTEKDTVSSAIKLIEAKGDPDFSTTATTDEGLYATEDDYGTSYYYRGAVEDNYVYFAGYYWRIIRRNGDGSVRLIYDGTEAHANGDSSDDRQIGTSAFNEKSNDTTYVGYVYGENFTLIDEDSTTSKVTYDNISSSSIYYFSDSYSCTNSSGTYSCSLGSNQISGTWSSVYSDVVSTYMYTCFSTSSTGTCTKIRKVTDYQDSTSATIIWLGWTSDTLEDTYGTTNSTIKEKVDSWYETYIAGKSDGNGNAYSDYISDEIFCGDREASDLSGVSLWHNNPITERTYYRSYYRIVFNKSPSLICTNKEDMYTVDDTIGNGLLTSPVALITIDEASLAGGVYATPANYQYYLYTGYTYWTMTPSLTSSYDGIARVWRVYYSGMLSDYRVTTSNVVRPVINISASVEVAGGKGTSSSPYELELP